MQQRTDLAVEQEGIFTPHEGIILRRRGRAFRITEIEIDSDEHGAVIERGKGKYLTLELPQHSDTPSTAQEQAEELAEELRHFLPEGAVLIAGLGNADITPDALGPEAAGRILATRHLAGELGDNDPELSFLRGLRPVSVLANGVLGQTGIETAELIRALRDTVKPGCIIAIDALACSAAEHLGTTVQISDAGISPGSGVQNRRAELSAHSLGIPVIAVGVPTVIDLHTVVQQAAGDRLSDFPNMMVTPRDIDKILHRAARLIAEGINLALHPQLNYADIEALG